MDLNEKNIALNSGARMPVIGLGTWQSSPDKVGQAVEHALSECGYSHIDCAAIYRNEKMIGQSLKNVFDEGKRKREEVFVTSKLWITEHRKEKVRKACETSLADLNLDYVDLYLMHWGIAAMSVEEPNSPNRNGRLNEQLDTNGVLMTENVSIRETWEAMEELVNLGLVKTIGIANFTAPMLVDLISYAKIKPAVNQIELHPYLQQQELVEFCKYQDIAVTAYSPLGSPGNNFKEQSAPTLIEDETIVKIAHSHHKSPAQILIRWGIQRDTIVIPKSVTPERIKENIEVFDFELSQTDMQSISHMNKNFRFVNPYPWWKIPYFG